MSHPAPRTGSIDRTTGETSISLKLVLDGTGQADVNTGIGFFDHMLTLLAKHGLFDLTVKADGDLEVDGHHTVEDTGICFGQALAQAIGDKAGLTRYGHFTLPMEETLATTAVDLCGRYWYEDRFEFSAEKIGTFDTELVSIFWQAVTANALMNLHQVVHYGKNNHHISEGIFKATARALREAVQIDPRQQGVASSKGVL